MTATPPTFSVFVAMRNAEPYVIRSLGMLRSQDFRDWHAIVIDDASTDATADRVLTAVQGDPRFEFVRRTRRLGKLANFASCHAAMTGSVIVEYDGDDAFWTTKALSTIAAAYTDPEVDATSGGNDFAARLAAPIASWPPCHRYALVGAIPYSPRTFRRSLLVRLLALAPDFLVNAATGEPYDPFGDVVLAAPAMLLARRIATIPLAIYHVNSANPQSDIRTHSEAAFDLASRQAFGAMTMLEQAIQGPVEWGMHNAKEPA